MLLNQPFTVQYMHPAFFVSHQYLTLETLQILATPLPIDTTIPERLCLAKQTEEI